MRIPPLPPPPEPAREYSLSGKKSRKVYVLHLIGAAMMSVVALAVLAFLIVFVGAKVLIISLVCAGWLITALILLSWD